MAAAAVYAEASADDTREGGGGAAPPSDENGVVCHRTSGYPSTGMTLAHSVAAAPARASARTALASRHHLLTAWGLGATAVQFVAPSQSLRRSDAPSAAAAGSAQRGLRPSHVYRDRAAAAADDGDAASSSNRSRYARSVPRARRGSG